jgi:uncharacterized protein
MDYDGQDLSDSTSATGGRRYTGGTPVPHTADSGVGRSGPVPAGERLVAVDTLRGFAVFGILLVNMAFFSAPVYIFQSDVRWWTATPDRVAEFAIRTLAEGKFYTLFSFLFGLGMALQMQRIEARGGRFVRTYVRRLLVLLVIGLCHALLLWFGDILTAYAVLGFPLLLFRKWGNRTILIWALVCYVLPLLVVGALTAGYELSIQDPKVAAETAQSLAYADAGMLTAAERSIAIYSRGSFAEIFLHRLENCRDALVALALMVPVIFTMFLLGLYAGRQRLLHEPERHPRLLRRLVVWGLPLGLLCNVGYAAALEWSSRIEPSWALWAGYAVYTVGMPLLSFGYAAGIVLLVQQEPWRTRLAPLAAVGRMALTNYLLQTLICTTLFYSYGLSWFGRMGPALGVLLTVAIYALRVPLSVWWLNRFRFGPAEWLWRSLTYGRWQRMRLAHAGFPPPTQGLIE